MSHLTLKELDFSRCRRWILDAHTKRDSDSVYCFLATWISFNHFYGTFASANRAEFQLWSKKNASREGDKAQWMFLVTRPECADFLAEFRTRKENLFKTEIALPVMNMLNGKAVPDGVAGNTKLSELKSEQLFEVIYQIRNNLFHGDKDPFKSERDKSLSRLGGAFMLPFASALVSDTAGEVLNAFDKAQADEKKAVASIAKSG